MSIILAEPGVIASSRRRTSGGTILGYNVKGGGTSGLPSGRMEVSKFTLATAGTLTELHCWYAGSGSPAAQVRIVVYDDDGSGGLPGTRLGYTNILTLDVSSDRELSETGLSLALAAGDYWLGTVSNSATTSPPIYNDTGGNHQQKSTSVTFTPPQTPFGTPNSSGTRKHSVWGIIV